MFYISPSIWMSQVPVHHQSSTILPYFLSPATDIMQLIFALAVGLGHLAHFTQAACGTALKNTATGCNIGSPLADGETVYYNPSDTMEVTANYIANGNCGEDTFAQATLVFQGASGARYDCGCLSLDGTFRSPLKTVTWYWYPIVDAVVLS
jgi:hypothetical protein